MKKISVFLFAFILVLFSSSCSLRGPHLMERLFDTDTEVANRNFEQVIKAVQNRDTDSLKTLFSKNAVESSENFEKDAIALFDFFQGEMVSYDDWGGGGADASRDQTGEWKFILSTYDVETDKAQYRFAIKQFTKDTTDPDNIGIDSLYVIRAENSNLQYAYWGEHKWKPGITVE